MFGGVGLLRWEGKFDGGGDLCGYVVWKMVGLLATKNLSERVRKVLVVVVKFLWRVIFFCGRR